MAISTGDTLPDASVVHMGAEGPETLSMSDKLKGRKVVLFGLPGAFTGTCTTAHVPSFIRTADQLAAKGVDEIICLSVNDVFVMDEWGKSTGAKDAGITMVGDATSEFTKAIGMDFDAPPVGLYGRSKRYAMLVEDGVVSILHAEENPGVCDVSGGESMLDAMG